MLQILSALVLTLLLSGCSGKPEPPARAVRLREMIGLRSRRGGLLTTAVDLGAPVRRGDVLARIASVYGDEVETIVSPVDGLYVRSTTLSTVAAGERVATVGVPE